MPYKDKGKQREAQRKSMKRARDVKPDVKPVIRSDVKLYWYREDKREVLKECPEGCYVLSDGQVHDPFRVPDILPSGGFIQRIIMSNRADLYRSKGTSPEVKLKLKELMS